MVSEELPESDVYWSKVEVCEQVCSAMGERLLETEIMIGWTTIRTPNCTKKTWAMAILAKPEHYAIIRKLAMQMRDKGSNMYPVTNKWVAMRVIGSMEEEQAKVE